MLRFASKKKTINTYLKAKNLHTIQFFFIVLLEKNLFIEFRNMYLFYFPMRDLLPYYFVCGEGVVGIK